MTTNKQINNIIELLFVYKKMASTHNSTLRYIPIWSTFLPHILYTHLQSKCSLHIQNKYIYTEKEKKKTHYE